MKREFLLPAVIVLAAACQDGVVVSGQHVYLAYQTLLLSLAGLFHTWLLPLRNTGLVDQTLDVGLLLHLVQQVAAEVLLSEHKDAKLLALLQVGALVVS